MRERENDREKSRVFGRGYERERTILLYVTSRFGDKRGDGLVRETIQTCHSLHYII